MTTRTHRPKSATNNRKALLLITDGEDNHSRYSFQNIKEFIREEDVQIFVIGIVDSSGQLDPGQRGRGVIEDLAISGGEAFFPESADARSLMFGSPTDMRTLRPIVWTYVIY